MTDNERAVLAALQDKRPSSCTASELASITGISVREVVAAIQVLVRLDLVTYAPSTSIEVHVTTARVEGSVQ